LRACDDLGMALPRLHSPASPAASTAPRPTESEASVAEAVEVYHRTYTTLLRSTGEMRLRVLEMSHKAMGAALHPLAASPEIDLGAFLYALRRLPETLLSADRVVMGQSFEVFARHGFAALDSWRELSAPGRRRRWFDDGHGTLAVLIASASDVDDLVPTLVAFQIEWNKLHTRLVAAGWDQEAPPGVAPVPAAACASTLGGREDDWAQLIEAWDAQFASRLAQVGRREMSLKLRMLGGTQVGYARVTRHWWEQVTGVQRAEGLLDRPLYFVSSNSHSLVNLVSGLAQEHADELVEFVQNFGPAELREELQRFREGRTEGDWNNFLYYAARLWFRSVPADSPAHRERRELEQRLGIHHVSSRGALDVAAQVINLSTLDPARFDTRLGEVDAAALRASRAVIVNIDYPLGLAAYNILREIAETAGELRGVYILGKAATLNADVGDVMLSNVIHDEHSGSTYWLDNVFSVNDIAPWLRFGSGLDNQRAVTVKGTFLQNHGYLDFYYREAFTVVEMEAGPYCAAVYELSESGRYPAGEPVNFSKLPIDLGVIHYASDTPFTQARTLGARGLSYFGMDSTYAASVAIVRRVLKLEGALRDG
jgi:hypothetical protein